MVIKTLSQLGYNLLEFLLTPLSFGIPNSRLRYYLLARLEPLSPPTGTSTTEISRYIPGRETTWVDDGDRSGMVHGTRTVRDYLDHEGSNLDDCTIPPRVLEKWGRLFDIVLPASYRTCCFTRGLWINNQLNETPDHRQDTPKWLNELVPSSRKTSHWT
jgi:tRNA (cytosine38-C5)-methyltransferase